jgi:hypothetical protein
MTLPARMAVLNHLDEVGESNIQEVMTSLEPIYGQEKQFTYDLFLEHLMALEANDLASLTKYELDKKEELVLYYDITEDGRSTVEKFVPKK